MPVEVRQQDLEARSRGPRSQVADAVGEVAGPVIAQVVAVDGGNDHVAQSECGHRVRQLPRFRRVRRLGPAVGHVAEGAAAGAEVAEDHEGRGAVTEALAQVRALGLLAHRRQTLLAQQGLTGVTAGPTGALARIQSGLRSGGAEPGQGGGGAHGSTSIGIRATLSWPR